MSEKLEPLVKQEKKMHVEQSPRERLLEADRRLMADIIRRSRLQASRCSACGDRNDDHDDRGCTIDGCACGWTRTLLEEDRMEDSHG